MIQKTLAYTWDDGLSIVDIYVESNPPLNIIQQIPETIDKCLPAFF